MEIVLKGLSSISSNILCLKTLKILIDHVTHSVKEEDETFCSKSVESLSDISGDYHPDQRRGSSVGPILERPNYLRYVRCSVVIVLIRAASDVKSNIFRILIKINICIVSITD